MAPSRQSTRGEDLSHSPALCLSSGDGSLALLQWISNSLVLRRLAARAADRHFSLYDLCLPEAGLAKSHKQKSSLQNLPVQHLKRQVPPLALTDSQRKPQIQQRVYHADLFDAAQVDGPHADV